MRSLTDTLPARADRLVVLLPPAQTQPEDYVAQGFVAALRARGLTADVQIPALDYTHVMARRVIELLDTAVLAPARAAGYREIWLAGISLGAHNALLCAAAREAQLAGLCLIAPYVGTGDVIAEIRAAGGPRAWAASGAGMADERVFWHWLARRDGQAAPLPLWFGTGAEDRFVRGQKMLAELLPANAVHFAPGRHDWPTWLSLWNHWLDHGPLARAGDAA
ncbi:MAG: hypothetical protein REI09_14780 [Candidatus Dactylopiibacterium sp.]|nr:hypothetical protein [Candidatus Dactylopiibacterium sp.]